MYCECVDFQSATRCGAVELAVGHDGVRAEHQQRNFHHVVWPRARRDAVQQLLSQAAPADSEESRRDPAVSSVFPDDGKAVLFTDGKAVCFSFSPTNGSTYG